MIKVTICWHDEVPDREKWGLSNNGSGAESASYLLIEYDGELVQVESSAMEPEDVSFHRDLYWVKEAITTAYDNGFVDGRNST